MNIKSSKTPKKTTPSTKITKDIIKREAGLKTDNACDNAIKVLKEQELISVELNTGYSSTYTVNYDYYMRLMYCLNQLENEDVSLFCEAFLNHEKEKLIELGFNEKVNINNGLESAPAGIPTSIEIKQSETENNQQHTLVKIIEGYSQKLEGYQKQIVSLSENLGSQIERLEAIKYQPIPENNGGDTTKSPLPLPENNGGYSQKLNILNNTTNKEEKMNYTNEMSICIGEEDNREENIHSFEKEPKPLTEESGDSFSSSDNMNLLPDNNQRNIEKQEEIDKIEWDKFMNIETSSEYNKEETEYPEYEKIEEIKKAFKYDWGFNKKTEFSKMQDCLIQLTRDFEIMRIKGYLYNDPELLKYLFPELRTYRNGMWYRACLDI